MVCMKYQPFFLGHWCSGSFVSALHFASIQEVVGSIHNGIVPKASENGTSCFFLLGILTALRKRATCIFVGIRISWSGVSIM